MGRSPEAADHPAAGHDAELLDLFPLQEGPPGPVGARALARDREVLLRVGRDRPGQGMRRGGRQGRGMGQTRSASPGVLDDGIPAPPRSRWSGSPSCRTGPRRPRPDARAPRRRGRGPGGPAAWPMRAPDRQGRGQPEGARAGDQAHGQAGHEALFERARGPVRRGTRARRPPPRPGRTRPRSGPTSR